MDFVLLVTPRTLVDRFLATCVMLLLFVTTRANEDEIRAVEYGQTRFFLFHVYVYPAIETFGKIGIVGGGGRTRTAE